MRNVFKIETGGASENFLWKKNPKLQQEHNIWSAPAEVSGFLDHETQ